MLLLFIEPAPVRAQIVPNDRPHRLVIDPSVVQASESRPADALKPPPESSATPTLDIRPLIASVTDALTATPHRRAADAALGAALIAFGTRRHHPASSAVFVGVHAVHLAVGDRVPTSWRGFEIQPDIGKDHFVITVRRTLETK